MNAFLQHHGKSIRYTYSCFDRILFNVIIPVLQRPASIVWFLTQSRAVKQLTKSYFRQISAEYHRWVEAYARDHGVPIVEPPSDVRREEWVDPFYQQRGRNPGVAVILKSRENAFIAVSFPTRGASHIEMCTRLVQQYYFYIRDQEFGRMFVRICPYFPFNVRLCINGHEWLACQLRREEIRFQQPSNAFTSCSQPARLQELADRFSYRHVRSAAQRWLTELIPFFKASERDKFGHQLFVSQAEYCTNLVFQRRVALDRMAERLLDLNRAIGRPDKLAIIFGRRITRATPAGIKTQISDYHLGNPVIRSDYKSSSIKQYVRDNVILRTEATTYHTRDLGLPKSVEYLPELRQRMAQITDRYLDVQQDVLETFVDRNQLRQLREPTVSARGRRTPGWKLDDPRLLAVMQALTSYAHLAHGGRFRTKDLHPAASAALGKTTATYTLTQLRYDLAKLRAKGLVEKVPRTQTYQLKPEGYRLCVLFLKLFHRIYAPLTAGTLKPVRLDAALPEQRRATLDRLYHAVDRSLKELFEHVCLRPAA